jgi:hypothetical protein
MGQARRRPNEAQMTSFPDKLRLKEQAEEDTWFARRDRALLEALRRRGRGIEVVSGGQTGVDRAALDAALDLGLAAGGWCPLGRRAEDGPIPGRYPLRETPAASFAQRTEWNVRDSDATLILYRGALAGGSARTAEHAARYRRPLLALDLSTGPDPAAAADWVVQHRVRVLNCAGPRESGSPGTYAEARAWLVDFLGVLAEATSTQQGKLRR